jgi:hypothetical protein
MRRFATRVALFGVLLFILSQCVFGQPRFEVPLTVSDGVQTGTLYFGIVPGADRCLHSGDCFNDHCEYELPFIPPDGVFDARYFSPPNCTNPINMSWSPCDFRPFLNASQRDTFRVRAQRGAGTTMIFSWLAGLSAHFSELTIRYFDPDSGHNINIDMLTDTSVTITGVIGSVTVPIFSGGVIVSSAENDAGAGPRGIILFQNYPNPFNPSTNIGFKVQGSRPSDEGSSGNGGRAGFVSLKVYDMLGHEVATLLEGEQVAGEHTVEWRPEGLSSGIYTYRLTTSHATMVKKMLLLR